MEKRRTYRLDSNGIDAAAKPDLLSVSSLNRMARTILESNFPAVVVEGEISNLAQPASGHWYLSLKDKSAQIRCAMFANRNRSIRFRPENGQQVILKGKLSLYEGRGDYQLIVDAMEEAGDGALQRAFEALKNRLQEEGLFEERHKKTVSNNYRHIGLITSATGAAVQDMITVFARRFPAIKLTVFPVSVQGKAAAAEIVAAIELANSLASTMSIDALIVGRGGGSLEDLQAFNEEAVARAIFSSQLFVTSAVGHEVDFTIADFVADLRAPTPSAAAELMSPSLDDLLDVLRSYEISLAQQIRGILSRQAQQVRYLVRQLRHPTRQLQNHAQALDALERRFSRALKHKVQSQHQKLSDLTKRIQVQSPDRRLKQTKHRVDAALQQLRVSFTRGLQRQQASLSELARGLNTVSPLNTLARGYSITFDESGNVVRSLGDVAEGDIVVSQLEKGRLTSVVKDIKFKELAGNDDS